MNKNIFVFLGVAVLVAASYFIFSGNQPVVSPTQSELPTQPSVGNNVIIYTDSGYSPAALTIKVGEMVTFENKSSRAMWTASAFHPSHAVYGGTSLSEHCSNPANNAFDECASAQSGDSWTFKFDKIGSWNYHNHVSPRDFGTIVAQ
ncbi:MAG: hypothetical protein AAB432_03160 [Patescibacteria group bacterium]